MKFRTFRLVVAGGAVAAAVVALAVLFTKDGSSSSMPPPVAPVAPVAAPAPIPVTPVAPTPPAPTPAPAMPVAPPEATPPPAGAFALRDIDHQILDRVARGIKGPHQKDAIAGATFKLDLYQDAGSPLVNRAKIDLNRNGKWDEKWTFSGAEVKREVAPADDEEYTDKYRLVNGAWVRERPVAH